MRLHAIIVVAALVLCAGTAFAQVPHAINYQGVLTGPDGQAVADGDYDMTFRLYYEQTEGDPIWEEIRVVNVTKGIFRTYLGGINPLDLPFETLYWLGISVAGQPELEPRIPLVSSPYCLTARTVQDSAITAEKIANFTINGEKIAFGQVVRNLNGLSDEVGLIPGANISITPSDNNLVISATGGSGSLPTGSAGQTLRHTGSDWAANSMLYNDGTSIGIGTTSPQQTLHVAGIARFDLGSGQVHMSTPGGWPGLIAFAPGGNRRDIVFDDNRMYLAASSSASAPSSSNGIVLLENGRIGIGTGNPNARLRVESNEHMTGVFASTYQSDTTEVLRANYLGGGSGEASDPIAVARRAAAASTDVCRELLTTVHCDTM